MSETPPLRIDGSPGFPEWLARIGASLAVTAYQTGKLFLIGVGREGRPAVFERTFDRAMGLHVSAGGRTLHLAALHQIWRLEDALDGTPRRSGFDRLYVPQAAWTTGELDVHDLALDRQGRLLFVNTRMNCLATVDERHSFRPLWRPPFVSALVAEDRCHLNGLAMRDGRPTHVTAIARSDVVDGWRDHRRDGGVLVDLATDRVVVEGLSMPHAPRWHRGTLWLLESGTGWFGALDADRGRFEPRVFCPGYARGLAFLDRWAVIGLSLPRRDAAFEGLALEEELARRHAAPRCGLLVVDLETFEVRHWLRFSGIVEELFEVAFLPATRRPRLIGLRGEEIRRVITVGPGAALFPGDPRPAG